MAPAEEFLGDAPDPHLVPWPGKALGRVPDPSMIPWPAVGGPAPADFCEVSHDKGPAADSSSAPGSLAVPAGTPDFGETVCGLEALDPHGIFPAQGVRRVPSKSSEVALLLKSAAHALGELLPWASGDASAQVWNLCGASPEDAEDHDSPRNMEADEGAKTQDDRAELPKLDDDVLSFRPASSAAEPEMQRKCSTEIAEVPEAQPTASHELAATPADKEPFEPEWARLDKTSRREDAEPAKPHWAMLDRLAAGAGEAERSQPLWARFTELAPKPHWVRHQQKTANGPTDQLECSSGADLHSHPSDKVGEVEEEEEDVIAVFSADEVAAAAMEASLESKGLIEGAASDVHMGVVFSADGVPEVEIEDGRKPESVVLAEEVADEADIGAVLLARPDAEAVTPAAAESAAAAATSAAPEAAATAAAREANQAPESKALSRGTPEAAAAPAEAHQGPESIVLARGAVAEAGSNIVFSLEAASAGASEPMQVLGPEAVAQGSEGVAAMKLEESRKLEPTDAARGAVNEVDVDAAISAFAHAAALEGDRDAASHVLCSHETSEVAAATAAAEAVAEAVAAEAFAVTHRPEVAAEEAEGVAAREVEESREQGHNDLAKGAVGEVDVGAANPAETDVAGALEANQWRESIALSQVTPEVAAAVLEVVQGLESEVLALAEADAHAAAAGAQPVVDAAEDALPAAAARFQAREEAAIFTRSPLVACSESAQKHVESPRDDMPEGVIENSRQEAPDNCDLLPRSEREGESIQSSNRGLVPRPPASKEGSCAGGSVFTALRWCRTAAGGAMLRFRPRKRRVGDGGCASSVSSESSEARKAPGSLSGTWP